VKAIWITLFTLGIGCTAINAQTQVNDTTIDTCLSNSLDSLLGKWHADASSNDDFVPDTLIIDSLLLAGNLPDSVIIQRLSEIISPFPFPFNSKVKGYIDFYVRRKRDQVERMLGLSEYYFPQFEAALDAQNLPLELKFLPIIESALNPIARSRANAVGLWQFMFFTGKRYGLEITSYVDERMDVAKSSEAAASFLSDLYKIYGDWHLVIAAYNCGPGNVNKAIRRAGGKRDYWQIYAYLPKETRNYVPAFIAATYAMTYHKEHQLFPRPTLLPTSADTIMVDKLVHFEQVSSVLGISVQQIRDLNPHYRRDVVPGSAKKAYPLRLPFDQTLAFASFEDSIYLTNRSKYFANEQLIVNPSTPTGYDPYVPANSATIYHTVRSGDTPGGIAAKYHVGLSNLKSWNNMRNNIIRVGQRLVVYVPKDRASQYSGATVAMENATNAKPSQTASGTGDYIYYTVRSGDNLWSIAQKFPGVSNSDIMSLNNLQNSKLSVGQTLKIKPKS
jgi:membrane-bound lytic murein transglycosylase D